MCGEKVCLWNGFGKLRLDVDPYKFRAQVLVGAAATVGFELLHLTQVACRRSLQSWYICRRRGSWSLSALLSCAASLRSRSDSHRVRSSLRLRHSHKFALLLRSSACSLTIASTQPIFYSSLSCMFRGCNHRCTVTSLLFWSQTKPSAAEQRATSPQVLNCTAPSSTSRPYAILTRPYISPKGQI